MLSRAIIKTIARMESTIPLTSRESVEAALTEQGIPFTTITHPEVHTVEQALPHMVGITGIFLKNLFLKDKKGRFMLFSAPHDAQTPFNTIAKLVGGCGGGLRAAPEESLEEILKVQRGAVTPFAAVNDTANQVLVLFHKDILNSESVVVHPMVNTASTSIQTQDLMKFLNHFGKQPQILDFAAPAQAPAQKGKGQQQKKAQAEGQGKKETKLGLSVQKSDQFSQWYTEVITKGEMIEYYDVSGCYIIRPWAYRIWEFIVEFFDGHIKQNGVKNSYFPMFVTNRALNTEKEHVEGFSAEVAWVTKYGTSDLAEPIAIRPTSETIMYPAFAKWIRGHRDLPLKLNQWCSVVRWEFKQPTPFLRTREFLWQEGHTAHATYEEATEQVLHILDLYARVYRELLAIPVVPGVKSEKEKFAGGDFTTTVETLIFENGRAIQGATSHSLGQNFSKMFDIWFEDESGAKKHVWQTSWGITTRTLGVLVMVHGDNKGLVLPPRIAPLQCIIVPIVKPEIIDAINAQCSEVLQILTQLNIRVEVDDRRNYTPGWKFNHWELKGVPLRIEIGPKDVENRTVRLVRRDTGEARTLPLDSIDSISDTLNLIQTEMLDKATQRLADRTKQATNWEDFLKFLNQGNIILTPWCQKMDCEEAVKERAVADTGDDESEHLTGAPKTLCMPYEQEPLEQGAVCFACGSVATRRVLWGRSY